MPAIDLDYSKLGCAEDPNPGPDGGRVRDTVNKYLETQTGELNERRKLSISIALNLLKCRERTICAREVGAEGLSENNSLEGRRTYGKHSSLDLSHFDY